MTQDIQNLASTLTPSAPPRRKLPAWTLSAIAIALAASALAYELRLNQTLRKELALTGKLQSELQALQQNVHQHQQVLEGRLARTEARENEAHSQHETLTGMYESLTRSEANRTLTEIEQMLAFASQQLQLTGNPASALGVLNAIDQRLALLNRPELIALRRAVTADLDTVKTMPALDIVGISAKLDNLLNQIDKLPLAIDTRREGPSPAPQQASGDKFTRISKELWYDIKQLVQIRRMDKPEAMLLTPEQAFFLRENIKLRILNARSALLARDEKGFRADLAAASSYLHSHFDIRAPQTTNAQELLKQLTTTPLIVTLPDLSASLAAVRGTRPQKVKP